MMSRLLSSCSPMARGQGMNCLFPSLPGGLITKPTLVWLLDAARGGEHDVRSASINPGSATYSLTIRTYIWGKLT